VPNQPDKSEVARRYEAALASFVEKAEQDPYILAVIVLGSLSYDTVWEHSDIDLCLVMQEGKLRKPSYSLVEDGISIHAFLQTRSDFKKTLEGSIGSSFMHSLLSKGRIVFSRDTTIDELYTNRTYLGDRDKEIRLLAAGAWLLPTLTKAHKWIDVKKDVAYSFLWLTKCLDMIATIEVVSRGEIATREVIGQAIRLSPDYFAPLYQSLIHDPKTEDNMRRALTMIETNLLGRAHELFKLVFDYLDDSRGVRSSTEISHYFSQNYNVDVDLVCEWLADMDLIDLASSPVRLTDRSRVEFDEAAYYFDRESKR